ncbi:hypothetical protein MF271_21180 (plasmid) [Deinococcus sp. KNUC1210]|uniref:hypothetical protein n=1 Tax=Deinococcus sp. KNUC1210 TaxID=2917691 RepID=UPI001EEFE784|nr:hypothetical protein [Deinococcus sp. KNUC1210]ULH17566.1 hypothetical protein MF271_21180 [Deinococcus sp. KNUC1210]
MKPMFASALSLALLSSAVAARLPTNLEPFKTGHVCVGRAEIQVRGKADDKLGQMAQDTLTKLAASLKLNESGESYTACPAWLSFHAESGNDADGKLVYASTLSLVTPKVQAKALGNLKDETFDYDGDFEYVTLWSETGYNTAATLDNLSFKLRADLVAQMGDFSADWKKAH